MGFESIKIMIERSFEKTFTGERAEERFNNEINFSQRFEFAPKIIRTDPQNLRLTYEFVEGDNLEFTEGKLHLIASVLAKLHLSEQQVFSSWPKTNLLARYQNSDNRELSDLVNKSKGLVPVVKYGLVHGDFRRRNIFVTGGSKVKVLDWEFAGRNFVYWDLAIFVGDMNHQRYHGVHSLSPNPFLDFYSRLVPLSEEELKFCRILGAVDVILDHLEPRVGEKLPIPRNLFYEFDDTERIFLLDNW